MVQKARDERRIDISQRQRRSLLAQRLRSEIQEQPETIAIGFNRSGLMPRC